MKVGYIAPMSIAAVNGGMRNQALNTIRCIQELGIQAIPISPWDKLSENELDLIHIFGASIENVGIVDQIFAANIPVALSTVFYSNRSSGFIRRVLKVEKFLSSFSKGIRSDFGIQRSLCKKADLLLPNTAAEAALIRDAFSISEGRIRVIPNGVESHFQHAKPKLFIQKYGIEDFVLVAGQAGAKRKNVIKLLEVAEHIDAPLVIIGSFYDDSYGKECKRLAMKAKNVTLIDTLDHNSDLLASAYAASKVFVLPSQFETPGIAAMEAALTGSHIVITSKGGTKEYFKEHAEYIDPNSSTSILNGINKALQKNGSEELGHHILQHFTWNEIGKLILDQYKTLIK